MEQTYTFETTDIYIASVLMTQGYTVEIRRIDGTTKLIFVVLVTDAKELMEVQNISNLYWQKVLKVDPCTLFGSFKTLKSQVFNQ